MDLCLNCFNKLIIRMLIRYASLLQRINNIGLDLHIIKLLSISQINNA